MRPRAPLFALDPFRCRKTFVLMYSVFAGPSRSLLKSRNVLSHSRRISPEHPIPFAAPLQK